MNKFINAVYSLLFITLILVACDSTVSQIDNIVFPEQDISFAEHVYPVLYTKCATAEGCHTSSDRAGGYSLESYIEITEPGLVDKYSPETSLLMWVLTGSQPHISIIPRPLTNNQVDGIRTWISEGALDN